MFPWEYIDGYTAILEQINQPHVDVQQVAAQVLDFMIELFRADKGEVVLFRNPPPDPAHITEENAVRCRVQVGYSEEQHRQLRDRGILLRSVQHALTARQSRVVQDTADETGDDADMSRLCHNGSWMNHVLEVNGEVVAFIHLAHAEKFRFDPDDLQELRGVSMLLATVLNVSRLWERERKHTLQLIKALNRVVEAKDEYTAAHVERVKNYSGFIARSMELDEEQCRLIETAAYLHDIGKVGISDTILKKPGPLTPEEREIMMQHVPIGERILADLPFLEEARHLASLHHEYVDGSGYGGMKELPLGARIVSVADAWDALTTTRPYRDAMTVEEAIALMTDLDVKQWDSGIVQGFVGRMRGTGFLSFAIGNGLIGLDEGGAYQRDRGILKFERFETFYAGVDVAAAAATAKKEQSKQVEKRFHSRAGK